MEVLPLTGGAAAQLRGATEWLATAATSACWPTATSAGTGMPVTFFGRPATMPAGPGAARRADRRRALPGDLRVHRRRLAVRFRPEVPVQGPAGCATGWRRRCRRVADAFTAGIAEQPEDWHMLGGSGADVPPDPPAG